MKSHSWISCSLGCTILHKIWNANSQIFWWRRTHFSLDLALILCNFKRIISPVCSVLKEQFVWVDGHFTSLQMWKQADNTSLQPKLYKSTLVTTDVNRTPQLFSHTKWDNYSRIYPETESCVCSHVAQESCSAWVGLNWLQFTVYNTHALYYRHDRFSQECFWEFNKAWLSHIGEKLNIQREIVLYFPVHNKWPKVWEQAWNVSIWHQWKNFFWISL